MELCGCYPACITHACIQKTFGYRSSCYTTSSLSEPDEKTCCPFGVFLVLQQLICKLLKKKRSAVADGFVFLKNEQHC